MASGVSNKETGKKLGISSPTVEDHRAHLMKKLGVRNATELVRMALSTATSDMKRR